VFDRTDVFAVAPFDSVADRQWLPRFILPQWPVKLNIDPWHRRTTFLGLLVSPVWLIVTPP